MSDQVSHPYKITGKIIVLYTLFFLLYTCCYTLPPGYNPIAVKKLLLLLLLLLLLYVLLIKNVVESQNSKGTELKECRNVRLLADKELTLHKIHGIVSLQGCEKWAVHLVTIEE
jgi:hypothetical protein